MKQLIFVSLLVLAGLNTNAQVNYEPTPVVTPQPIIVPQGYVPPPSRYLPSAGPVPHSKINVKFKMLIKSAKLNGKDYSQRYINDSSGIVLYRYEAYSEEAKECSCLSLGWANAQVHRRSSLLSAT